MGKKARLIIYVLTIAVLVVVLVKLVIPDSLNDIQEVVSDIGGTITRDNNKRIKQEYLNGGDTSSQFTEMLQSTSNNLSDGSNIRNINILTTIAAGSNHTVGLKTNGTVVAVGDNTYDQPDVSAWSDIISVSAGGKHTVGLKSDGTVVVAGAKNASIVSPGDYGQAEVSGWRDIIAIAAGDLHTVGLRSDGTVVAVGDNRDGQLMVSSRQDIVAISAGGYLSVGLKSDGTVVAVGSSRYGQLEVKDWQDIVSISTDVTGLKSDGTVLDAGTIFISALDNSNYNYYKPSNWQDIVAISLSVGLKSDGTVVAVGTNDFGECEVSDWRDIIAISATGVHTVGLKSDGTVVAAGYNGFGQCNVSDWQSIMTTNSQTSYSTSAPHHEALEGLENRFTYVNPVAYAGYLLGGSLYDDWISAEYMANLITKDQPYKLYSFKGLYGTGIGGEVSALKDWDNPSIDTTYHIYEQGNDLERGLVAVGGEWDGMPRIPQEQTADTYNDIAKDILEGYGLKNPVGNIIQNYRIDLDADGRDEVVLCAEYSADNRFSATAGDYSLLILRKIVGGTVSNIVLGGDIHLVSNKSGEWSNPLRVFYEICGFVDLNGDGTVEIIVSESYYEGIFYFAFELTHDGAIKIDKLGNGWGA